MADQAITDYTAKTTVNGNELLEVVDLREALAANQNKKMTIDTLFSSIVTHDAEVVIYDSEVVYSI